ncbi:MAG: hypothetical protein FJX76_07845 [Armatimonadetes bacterium]|nr:hypothetical protein [Armatimonadota bacterium]
MGRYIGIAVVLVFLWTLGWVEGLVDDFFLNRARPPADRPDQAPYAIPLPPGSRVDSHGISENDDQSLWTYQWEVVVDAPLKDVVLFYRERWPDGYRDTEDGVSFEFVPARASPDEPAAIRLGQSDDGKTYLEISETVKSQAWLPPAWVRQWGLYLGLLGLAILVWVLGRGTLAELLARVMMSRQMAAGGTKLARLDRSPADPVVTKFWSDTQTMLMATGFETAFDFYSPSVGRTNYARLMTRENKTFAVLYYVLLDQHSYTYVDFGTFFEDGSCVTTTSSRFVSDMKRPPEFPLETVSEGTAPLDELVVHEKAVARHGKSVKTVASEAIFDEWSRVEKAMFEYRKKVGFLSKEGKARIIEESKATSAPPPPAPAPPPVPLAPLPRPDGPPLTAPSVASAPIATIAAPAAPVGDPRKAFFEEIQAIILATHPTWEVSVKTDMELWVRSDAFRDVVDVEALYYLCQKPGIDREKAIQSFVDRIGAH